MVPWEIYVRVPTYRIRVINHLFTASDTHDAPSLEEAVLCGVKGALAIGIEQVSGDLPCFFGAEVVIEERKKVLRRLLVSVGASPLK